MVITGVPISFILSLVGLFVDKNKKPALITLLILLLVVLVLALCG